MSSDDPRAVEPSVTPSAGAPEPVVAGPAAPPPTPSVIGPAKPSTAVSAAAATTATGATPKPWSALVSVFFGLIVACAIVLTSSLSRNHLVVVGLTAFLAGFGVALASITLIRRKRAPWSINAVAAGALTSALAAVVASGVALYLRAGAEGDVAVFDLQQAGLGAYWLGQTQAAARGIAWTGLLAIPGFSFGALGLILAYGERKQAKRAAAPGAGAPALAVLALLGVSLLFLAGFGGTIAALVAPVDVVDHPMVPRLREVQGQLAHGDLINGCTGLEPLLVEEPADKVVVPRAILAVEIADYREFAHRCVTARIDALPKGLPCTAAAGALLGSELVRAARAEARVKHACDRPFD